MLSSKWTSKKLALVVILSAVGGIASIAVSYCGRMLSLTPLGPVAGQMLAGIHIFWLILVAVAVQNKGAATFAGTLKGVVQMMLPNQLGLFVFFMSLIEGAVVDLMFLPLKRVKSVAVFLASGFSSASNLLILQAFQLLPTSFAPGIYAAMYVASFLSGLALGGYLSIISLKVLRQILPDGTPI